MHESGSLFGIWTLLGCVWIKDLVEEKEKEREKSDFDLFPIGFLFPQQIPP